MLLTAHRRSPPALLPSTPSLAHCSLDASACALLSEDYPGTTRLHFQRELVACHSGAAARRHAGDVALVASASGRAAVALHPSSEPDALRAALDGLEPEGEANLEAALKLALVRLQPGEDAYWLPFVGWLPLLQPASPALVFALQYGLYRGLPRPAC